MDTHSHHSHAHAHSEEAKGGRLFAVILLNVVITVAEFTAGLLSGSLALVSDAGHNLSDVLALILGYAGEKATERKPTARFSFGFRRAEVLIALVNALSLVAIGAFVIVEAVARFRNPSPIDATLMLPVACIGLFGNLFSMLILRHERERNLNLRAAFLHLAFDTLSSVAVVGVGIVVFFRPWLWLDLIVSLLIVVMMVWSSIGIIGESLRILLQAAPDSIDPERVRAVILGQEGVGEVHGLHIWSVNSNEIFLSCHICLDGHAPASDRVIEAINDVLAQTFGIRHTTLQVETEPLCKGAETDCCHEKK